MQNHPFISDLSVYIPEQCISNDEVEQRVLYQDRALPTGMLEKVFGSKTRYYADAQMQVSDLAAQAARPICERTDQPIDLLIFAAASSDLIEPATSNIIQQKLGLTCPTMDVKNACNSFVSAMEIATAFVKSGAYSNILIVNGEKLSEVINFQPRDKEQFQRSFPGYSLGDAGAAMRISNKGEHRITYQKFTTLGQYWQLCTVAGGGSQAFRNPDKYFFEGDSSELHQIFKERGPAFVADCLAQTGWRLQDIAWLVTHQVSGASLRMAASGIGIPIDRTINAFAQYGNTAAASIPLALHRAQNENKLQSGDKVLLLGLAAGVSIGMICVEW